MNFRRILVLGMIMSLGLAFYRVWFEEPWFSSIESQGKSVGVGEVAIGYFGAWLIMSIIGYYLTKSLDGGHKI